MLMDMIWDYCNDEGFTKTVKAMKRTTNDLSPNLRHIFKKHFKQSEPQGLSFTFKLNSERVKLRKRISCMESEVTVKKQRKIKSEVVNGEKKVTQEAIPEYFLQLLDELGLDRNDARTLYEHKDKWVYAKSDRKIYCVELGEKFLQSC